ncbi:MAG: hypothetical protein FWE03_07375 [Firmicutes bacterium]|nr:hypothetical protein [Bacillota bacterium]
MNNDEIKDINTTDIQTASKQGYYFPQPNTPPHYPSSSAQVQNNVDTTNKPTTNPFSSLKIFVTAKLNFKGQGAKILSFALCMTLCLVALISLSTSILTTTFDNLTPFNLIFMRQNYAEYYFFPSLGLPFLTLSYWVARIYYMVFAVALLIIIAAGVFVFINKRRDKTSSFCDIAMAVLVAFLFFGMLLSLNFANLYTLAAPHRTITVGGIGSFIIGLIILILKYIVNFCFKVPTNDEFAKSKLSIASSFVLLVLVISTLFTPIYIFQPFYSMTGLDILLNRPDRLAFLPTVSTFRSFILIFLIVCFASFIINLILYITSKRIFVQYNKFNVFIGIIALALYALIGLNYVVILFDTLQYIPDYILIVVSWDTYAYLPLALFGMYILGLLFVKLTENRQNIEYKVYAKAGGRRSSTEGEDKKTAEDLEITGYDPIPAFSEIDSMSDKFEDDYQENLKFKFEGVTLPLLVDHIIEYAKNSPQNLSYGKREIKTFIAGLGASRLSILQGMSGTGKTSLPKIFTEAIGGICEMIAVESSWRDKNELLGYYNEFNKKFTPKAFTQSLYKASLNIDTPVFIVLDEMNLSRIEYYFSDFLSLMEAAEDERKIKLFDVQLYPEVDDRTEYLKLEHGHTLKIPNNIWFVGTANRDESTFEISDKVYDRAQTMNFDKRAPKILKANTNFNLKKFVTMNQLRSLFSECKQMVFDAEDSSIIKKIEKILLPYRISFGNRILKQIEEFVKVYVSASGPKNSNEKDEYIHEALDCIILSKIVRKLEFKQINDIDELIESFKPLKLPMCYQFLLSLQN